MATFPWLQVLAVAVGGAAGASVRFAANRLATRIGDGSLPVATLTVNLVGCFLIGLLGPMLLKRNVRPEVQVGLLVGVLGGLTTFSSYALELATMTGGRRWWMAAGYLTLSNVLGVTLVLVGLLLARRFA